MGHSRSEALRRLIEETWDQAEQEDVEETKYKVAQRLDFNKSTDSLESLSQQSDYSFGDDDITDAILALEQPELTQNSSTEPPPNSANSSDASTGKRKATDSFTSSRPTKQFKPTQFLEDDPFNNSGDVFTYAAWSVKPVEPQNHTAPISFSPSHTLQRMFVNKNIPYGVQYEIARHVSKGNLKYDDINVPKILELTGESNRSGVPQVLEKLKDSHTLNEDGDTLVDVHMGTAFAKEYAAKSPWAELDREEEALSKNPYGCLGFDVNGQPMSWYGGKILFHGKLLAHDTSQKGVKIQRLRIVLEPAELGPSNMFARRFGSKHFFRLKMSKQAMKREDVLLDFLRRPLFLCGYVFRAFFAKESNVFYVKTNEVPDTTGISINPKKTLPGSLSFLEFLQWHNPIEQNNNQTMAKFVSRFALGLSNSVPGLMLKKENIGSINDIISPEGSNMTDGAGKINRWSLNRIRHHLEWEDKPTAIQMRVCGTKGLLVEDPHNSKEFGYVKITPSQRKIKYLADMPTDPAHCIIDVLRASHTKTCCRLSPETIVCLAHGGVKKAVFIALLKKSLDELVEPLLEWETPESMRAIWANVRRLAGVMAARRAREESGLARVKGYSDRITEDDDSEDEEGLPTNSDISETKRSVAWWGDMISGCPSSIEETIMCMLDSGFNPKTCGVLREKLHIFIKIRINSFIKSYRIEVPMSATAFLVPDTTGLLEPGEVFFKSSRRQLLTPDGESDIYVGDVLVTRHPCKLPSDIQKMKSVDRPELHHLTDVIVFSTKGPRREADKLAGGDYDGDKGEFIIEPAIVNNFRPADIKYADPPPNINDNFHRENVAVVTFQTNIQNTSTDNQIRQFQKHLLGAVRNTSVVGKYSTYHDHCIYTLGYSHPETIRLAYMFCMTLDGIKSGMTVLPEVLKEDSSKYNKRAPEWKETDEERDRNQRNEKHPSRPRSLGKFIMDELLTAALEESKIRHSRLEEHFRTDASLPLDEDLVAPWKNAIALGERWKTERNSSEVEQDLDVIKKHVERIYNEHRLEVTSPNKGSRNTPKRTASATLFSSLPIEQRQDKMRSLSQKFANYPTTEVFMHEEEIARLRASYAYLYDYEQHRYWTNNYTRFPFDVAMRELCAIKARALGPSKTVSGEFYDHFNIKHPKKHHF